MIRITSDLPCPPWSLSFDDYIAATVRWATPSNSTPYYFRLRDDGESLIEIGVDPSTYAICKLNVVSISRLGSAGFPDAPVTTGLPVLEPSSDWNAPLARVDVRLVLTFSYVAPNLTAVLAGAEKATTVYDAGGARFAAAGDGTVVAIQVALPRGPHEARLSKIAGDS